MDVFSLLLGLALAALGYLARWIYSIATSPLTELPSPPVCDIVRGHLPKMQYHEQACSDWMSRMSREFPLLYAVRLAHVRVVVVTDPKEIDKILAARPDEWSRFSAMRKLVDEAGIVGVFTAEGERWRVHRRVTSPAFSFVHAHAMTAPINMVVARVISRWYYRLVAELGRTPEPGDCLTLDVCPDLINAGLDTVAMAAIGFDINAVNKTSDIGQSLECVLQSVQERALAVIPWWRIFKRPIDRKFDRARDMVRVLMLKALISRREVMDRDEKGAQNLLDAMLRFQESIQRDGKTVFADGELIGNLIQYYMAGRDTMAFTTSWTLYCLAKSPQDWQGVVDEVEQVLGDNYRPDVDTLDRLVFTEMCVKEASRMYPISQRLFHEPNQDVMIGPHHIPAGSFVMLDTSAIGRNPDYFPSPERFDPSRWSDNPKITATTANLYVFGGGTRLCPGRNLARLQVLRLVSSIAQHFDITLAPGVSHVEPFHGFTSFPKGGLPLQLKLRQRPLAPEEAPSQA